MSGIISEFVDANPPGYGVALLQLMAEPEQGGRGYELKELDLQFDWDGWHVNEARGEIQIDSDGWFSEHSTADRARYLKYAIETEFLGTREGLLSRFGWGSAKVLFGAVETVVGGVGIVVPEPGTTAAGVVVLTLGVNTIGDGVSQIFGANQGHGINVLAETFGEAGAQLADLADIDAEVGRRIGKGVFFVGSIAAGSLATIRIMHVPGKAILARNLAGQKGGIAIGRVDGLMKSGRAGDGMTIFSINNNANQSILRFVTHNGRLVVNGRIVGTRRVLVHETDPKTILKGLIELVRHGARF